ncbi:MAG: hypothetical protein ACI4PC_04305 [Oscillospiraceae bacterium]
MTDKELKRLSRSELLEMLIAQTEENQKLQSRLEAAEAQLSDRRIAIDKAGTLAEASLALNGVFEAAEAAAKQYVENIQLLSEKQDSINRKLQEETEQECRRLLSDAQAQASETKREAETQAAETRREAEEYSKKLHSEADLYWNLVLDKAEKLLQDHNALREAILSAGRIDVK